MLMSNTYASLHNHTDYSNASLGFADSINRYNDLIQTAYDSGLSGVAITDHESVSCHVKALKYFNEMQKDRPFQLILGNEIYLLSKDEDNDNKDYTTEENTPYYHFILNALDNEGHEQIRRISTEAWKRAYMFNGIMRRPTYYSDIENVIKNNKGHVIASTACIGGYVGKKIVDWKIDGNEKSGSEVQNFLEWCIDVFGQENFYLEIQPCNESNIEQKTVNETLMDIAEYYEMKLIATTDSHFMKKANIFGHKVLLNAKTGGDARETEQFYSTAYFMGGEELREYLKLSFSDEQIDWIFNNTNEIVKRVKGYNFEHAPMIPQIPLKDIPDFVIEHRYRRYYNKYKEFNYYAHIENIQDSYFFYRIEKALYELIELKSKDIETYIDRLDKEFHELRLISEAFNSSMASYYTTMSKIIELIWESDSLSMPARGSAAGFLVCYLLDITQIDPVPLGDYFPFWRHLSAERGVEIADIDNDSQNAKRGSIIESIRNYFGEDRVLNVITFSTLTAKTSVEKAGKGFKILGYDITDDTIGYLKSLIPSERGAVWSLSDCFYGNKEKGREPVKELISEVKKYEGFKECIFMYEGLIFNRGIHASGILIGNEPYVDQISAMRSPNDVLCSCYDLHDCEYCGWTKVDMLTIQASDKIRKNMDLLIEHGYMKWQGSLKATYWKYLHPDVLNYTEPKMWNMIKEIYSIFQFDTHIAVKSLNEVTPQSVMDLSATNSLLRLMAQDGKEAPLSRYVRYKKDINAWYKDMTNYGLTKEEQEILKKYLSNSYGLADSQEKVMLISMDKKASNFSLKQANKLRKAIAKKKADVLKETKELFFDSCKNAGTSEAMDNYIWNEEFAMSFGYSFSQLHSYSYSVIALQELNLNYFYPKIYWSCACLIVESQSDDENDKANGNSDYGKIAKAIYKIMKYNVNVLPPSVNKSGITFEPEEETNSILFGLGGISGVNLDIAKQIVDNRPYKDFNEFYQKNNFKGSLITKSKFVTLIKGGCFDETDDRKDIMKWLVVYFNPRKESLSISNIPNMISLGMDIPDKILIPYKFKKYVLSKEFFYCDDKTYKTKKHYLVEQEYALSYFEENYINLLKEEKDYYYVDEGLVVVDKSLEKAMDNQMEELKKYLSKQEVVDEYNKLLWEREYIDMADSDDVNKWSFDSLSFYPNGRHELENIDYSQYNLSHFEELTEEPNFITKSYGKRSWKQYNISRICGTVLDRKDKDHFITILTPDNEVIAVKFNAGQYSYYKQSITIEDEKDDNYFKRGTLVMICGYRRGEDEFVAKKYKNSLFNHTVLKITNVNKDGTLDLQFNRLGEESD